MALFLSALLHVVQAYGMAVVDEAPVFMLTSYNVSVFFKRSNDVEDKRLWASEPIWINQIDPSACAIWAQALQQAEELRGWKPMLQRAKVPPKVEEEADSLLSLSSLSDPARRRAADSSEPASSRSSASNASSVHSSPVVPSAHSGLGLSSVNGGPALSRKRRHADQQDTDAFRTPVSHMQRGGPCPRSHLNAYSPQSLAFQTYSHAAAAPEPAARDFEVEDTLPLSELGLTGELLGVCQHGYTLKVSLRAPYTCAPVFEAPAPLHTHPAPEHILSHCLPPSYLEHRAGPCIRSHCFVGRQKPNKMTCLHSAAAPCMVQRVAAVLIWKSAQAVGRCGR